MGLDSYWRKALFQIYPHAFLESIPEGRVDIVIDEFFGYLIQSLSYRNFGKMKEAIKNRILENRVNLEMMIMVMDEHEHVPECKEIERRKRAEEGKKKKDAKGEPIKPYEEETNELDFESGDFSDERMRMTSWAKPRLVEFATKAIISSVPYLYEYSSPTGPNNRKTIPTLVIDGARGENLKYKDVQICKERKDARLVKLPYMVGMDAETFPSTMIGEGDLKIVYHIDTLFRNGFKNRVIFVRHNDNDILFILLLNMRRWINQETGSIDLRIYYELRDWSNVDKKKRGANDPIYKYIDVVSLWRGLIDAFHGYTKKTQVSADEIIEENVEGIAPRIDFPVEVFTYLVLLSGSDYVPSIFKIGAASIWNAFLDMGKYLFYSRSYSMEDKRKVEKYTQTIEVTPNHKYAEGIPLLYDGSIQHDLSISEDHIMLFIHYMFQRAKDSNKRVNDQWSDLTPWPLIVEYYEKKKKKGINSLTPYEDFEMYRTHVRTAYWNMNYWMNGGINRKNVHDCLIQDTNKGSAYGYERVFSRDKNGNPVTRIEFARYVGRFNSGESPRDGWDTMEAMTAIDASVSEDSGLRKKRRAN